MTRRTSRCGNLPCPARVTDGGSFCSDTCRDALKALLAVKFISGGFVRGMEAINDDHARHPSVSDPMGELAILGRVRVD